MNTMRDPSDPSRDELALRAENYLQNEEGGKDKLHCRSTRTSLISPPGTVKKRGTANREDT